MHSTARRPRKALAALLPMIVGLALAGCSTSTGGNGAAPAATASDSGTVTVANPGDLTPAIEKAFKAAYPKINLKVQDFDGDTYSAKITQLVASNQAPDVMILFENDEVRLAKSGSIIPLDNYLKTGSLKTSDFIPAVANLTKQAGGTYGLPWCYATQVMYYNKDIFDKAGVDYPTDSWTWDDYTAAAKKLTSGSGGGKTWGSDTFSFPGMWYSLAGQGGDKVIDGSGNLVLGSGIQKALAFQNQLVNVDKSQPQPAVSGTNVTDLFASGKAAMSMNGSWAINSYKDAKFKWDVAPMPAGVQKYSTLHTAFYTISKASKNQGAAWTFINWMMSKEGQALTSQASSNPSAVKAYSDGTDWQHKGANGPTNFAAVTDTANTFGRFGYTLAPFAISNNLGNDFNSYLLGAKSLDSVMADVKKADSGQ